MDASEIQTWMGLVREVLVAAPVQDYAIRLLLATHPNTEYATDDANRFFRAGASPRGAQSLILAGKVRALLQGRFNVSFEDIRAVYFPAMRHRVLLNFEAQAEGISSDTILAAIIKNVKEREDKAG
jgi:MoxR-like ATPase